MTDVLQICSFSDSEMCVFHIFFFFFFFQREEIYLNLVLEFVPETVYRVARHYSKSKQTIPLVHVKV